MCMHVENDILFARLFFERFLTKSANFIFSHTQIRYEPISFDRYLSNLGLLHFNVQTIYMYTSLVFHDL